MNESDGIFKPEVHAFFLAPFLDQAEISLGRDRVVELLGDMGVTEAQLRDRSAWVSLRFCEALVRTLHDATEDPLLEAKAGRAAFSAKYMGPLRMIIRAFGDPATAYVQMARSLERFNKVGKIEVTDQSRGRITLAYRNLEGAPPEREVVVCEGRQANMAALPTLFDLPPAEVSHPRCMHAGADVCEYEIRFPMQRPRTRSRLALLGGGIAGAVTGLMASWGILATGGLALGVAAGCWAFARQLELRDRVGDLAETVVDQQDALVLSTRLNELRFEEVIEAKSEVEKKVDERTSELQIATGQLRQTLEELQTLDATKNDFFANISHELRTPLTMILSPLEALRARGTLGNDETLGTIENNARRLLRLINQLLDLAKLDAGEVTLQRAAVDVSALVEAIIGGFRPAARTRDIELAAQVSAQSAPFELDPGWMESALSNLIANAMRFAKSRVAIEVTDEGGELVFTVRDDGPGVPEEQLAKIFDRFAQGTQTRRQGTGLGLAIVKEAARLHGGRVDAESPPGEGATFRITIPRVVASSPAVSVEVGDAPNEPVPAAARDRDGPHAAAPLALVAEDHPELRAFIADVLASRFRVAAVADGEDALARATDLRPDVIVADVAMPGMDGLELCRRLRGAVDTRDIPVVLVTARGEPQQVLQGFDAGANDYLVKPFHGRELLARIDAQLRLRSMVHRLAHQERLASLGVLAASVAHQVRNPLTALVSGLPAVQRKIGADVDERTREMLDVFVDCAQRIERITLDLLDLSRVDREEEGALQPGSGLMAAIRLTLAQLPDDVDVSTDVDEKTSVVGRAGDLNHVFLNLLDNAARAVGRRGRLVISGHRRGERYEITIEDSGSGVPEEIVERIFEPFVTSRDPGEGTGLGLAIVHDIVVAHGGEIAVDRSPTLGGARFRVLLPVSGEEAAAAE